MGSVEVAVGGGDDADVDLPRAGLTEAFDLPHLERPQDLRLGGERQVADLVEEAVLAEFIRLDERGGVLGAMERQYQRSKIQEESLKYEQLKHSGELPIVGVNTFKNPHKSGVEEASSVDLTRASNDEKDAQIDRLRSFQAARAEVSAQALERLKGVALAGGNIFEELMETVRSCSLGEISQALFEVGGEYRRSM